jgi:hypothetical protein
LLKIAATAPTGGCCWLNGLAAGLDHEEGIPIPLTRL